MQRFVVVLLLLSIVNSCKVSEGSTTSNSSKWEKYTISEDLKANYTSLNQFFYNKGFYVTPQSHPDLGGFRITRRDQNYRRRPTAVYVNDTFYEFYSFLNEFPFAATDSIHINRYTRYKQYDCVVKIYTIPGMVFN